MIKKQDILSYVLVNDVSDSGQLYYYTGYYFNGIPVNTNNYTEAVKNCFEDEAKELCIKLNSSNKVFNYHVEEHCYFEKI